MSITSQVTVFIPTYKNYHLILSSIESCLNQTYSSLKIVVVDNGYSEDGGVLYEKIKNINDDRVVYIKNIINIGSRNNFHLIFEMACLEEQFIIIPADVILTPNAIEEMIYVQKNNNDVLVVFPRTTVRDSGTEFSKIKPAEIEPPLPWPHKKSGKIPAQDLINLFFSIHNIDSEWTHFNFLGALINGGYFRSIGVKRLPMHDHGWEEYLSLHVLSFTSYVYLIDKPLLYLYVNNVRYGSAARPTGFYTRYEPLFAEFKYLSDYEPLIIRNGMSISRMQLHTVIKFFYTTIRYPGPVWILMPKVLGVIVSLPFTSIYEIYKYLSNTIVNIIRALRK